MFEQEEEAFWPWESVDHSASLGGGDYVCEMPTNVSGSHPVYSPSVYSPLDPPEPTQWTDATLFYPANAEWSPKSDKDERAAAKRSKQTKTPPAAKNVSCCRGVYFDQIRHLWRANWPEESIIIDKATQRMVDIRRCTRTKGFSAKKYGYQEAQRLAIEHREKMTGPGMVRHFVYRDETEAPRPKTPPQEWQPTPWAEVEYP